MKDIVKVSASTASERASAVVSQLSALSDRGVICILTNSEDDAEAYLRQGETLKDGSKFLTAPVIDNDDLAEATRKSLRKKPIAIVIDGQDRLDECVLTAASDAAATNHLVIVAGSSNDD